MKKRDWFIPKMLNTIFNNQRVWSELWTLNFIFFLSSINQWRNQIILYRVQCKFCLMVNKVTCFLARKLSYYYMPTTTKFKSQTIYEICEILWVIAQFWNREKWTKFEPKFINFRFHNIWTVILEAPRTTWLPLNESYILKFHIELLRLTIYS